MFTHDAVVDHIKCGANEVEAAQVTIEMKKLSEKNRNGVNGFEEKFMVGRTRITMLICRITSARN